MTNILAKLVQGWTGLSARESDEVGRHFRNVAGAGPSRPVSVHGRYEYSCSDEPVDTQENLVHGDSEWGHGEDDDEGVEAGADVDVDMDKPSEGDGGGHDGPAAGAVRQDTEIDKGGWSHEAQVIGGAGGSGGGVAVPSKRGREGVGDGVDGAPKRARVDPVAARRRYFFAFMLHE